MGGGGGLSPIPIITDLILGGGISALTSSLASGRADTSSADAAAAIQAENARRDQAAAEAALESRKREQRQARQAALLEQNRARKSAARAESDALAATLGAPSTATANLKEKLGQ